MTRRSLSFAVQVGHEVVCDACVKTTSVDIVNIDMVRQTKDSCMALRCS